MNCDHLAEMEAEVWCLWEELEASQKVQVELCECWINAIVGVDMAQEWLVEQGARDQSQIGLLTTQVANLKVAIVVQEAERTAVDVARDMAEQGHRCLEAECRGLRSTCTGEFFFAHVGS